MRKFHKAMGTCVALALLAGCAAPDPYASGELKKGEQLDIRNILAAHPNKRACIQYQAATNSCSSIITSTVEGNMMISHEVAAVKTVNGNGTQQVEVVTRSNLRGKQACTSAGDISVTGRDQMSAFLLQATRDAVSQFGGSVCATYYRSGDGYIVSSVGANGQPFPPGDVEFQFITGEASLRAQ